MEKACKNCGFVYERDPGYFLGSTYINYGLTTFLTTWMFVVLRFGVGVSKSILVPGVAAFSVIFPLVFFRYARSFWLSFDCWFDKTGAMEIRTNSPSSAVSEKGKKNPTEWIDSSSLFDTLPRSHEGSE